MLFELAYSNGTDLTT